MFFLDIEKGAQEKIASLQRFTFDAFKEAYFTKQSIHDDLFSMFQYYIDELREQGRVGTAVSYECALNSIINFVRKPMFEFALITPAFLKSYENWMVSEDNSLTTVGIYLRCVRRLFNLAIKRGIAEQSDYPFGSDADLYRIPEPQNVKKALTLEEIKKIFHYDSPAGSPEQFYKDIWVFSYLCNGINIKDICLLRYGDLEEESIRFRRAKTALTNRKSKPITAARIEQIDAIIERWGVKPIKPQQFIFPFITPGMTPEGQNKRVRQIVKQTNKYIKRVAEEVGIKTPVSTYTARHSFATVLRNSGTNVAFISEMLGHTNVKTTESYLASIGDDTRKKIAEHLTDFGE